MPFLPQCLYGYIPPPACCQCAHVCAPQGSVHMSVSPQSAPPCHQVPLSALRSLSVLTSLPSLLSPHPFLKDPPCQCPDPLVSAPTARLLPVCVGHSPPQCPLPSLTAPTLSITIMAPRVSPPPILSLSDPFTPHCPISSSILIISSFTPVAFTHAPYWPLECPPHLSLCCFPHTPPATLCPGA